jgi:hypothetical protein
MKKTAKIIVPLFLLVLFICSSYTKGPGSESLTSISSDQLHFSFKTPDWNGYVPCKLDFDAIALNDSTNVIAFDSASTNASLCFSYPKDSSAIVKNRQLKRYKIKSHFENNAPFQFYLKLPSDKNSLDDLTKRLFSNAGFSETEYNEVAEVKYLKSEPNCAVFIVKCNYKLNARIAATPKLSKPVSGTFTFLVRTSKV